MAYKQQRNVRVCYAGTNNSIKRYLGREEMEQDKTRSISQVSKLLQARAITPDELTNYAMKIGPNLELMDSWSENLTTDEMNEILTFVYSRSSSDVTVCDMGSNISGVTERSLIEQSDVVIFVATPSAPVLENLREMREKDKRLFSGCRQALLVNMYDAGIAPLKWCAQTAGFSLRDTCKLHWNPYITKGCNIQDLQSVILTAYEKDPRVVELYMDMKEVTLFLMSINSEKSRWED